jgi:hypothetical protein
MLKLSRALVYLEEMGQQEGNDSQLAFLGPILARQPDCSASLSNTFQLISGCNCEAGIGVFKRLYLPLCVVSLHDISFSRLAQANAGTRYRPMTDQASLSKRRITTIYFILRQPRNPGLVIGQVAGGLGLIVKTPAITKDTIIEYGGEKLRMS